jgi:phage gp29-like protein
MAQRVIKKSISQSRKDIADWNLARQAAQRAESPRFYLLQDLFDTVADDALLTSQVNNRQLRTVSAPFEMADEAGKVDDRATENLANIGLVPDIVQAILDSELYGYNVIEFAEEGDKRKIHVLPRRNIDPTNGLFYPDAYGNTAIAYREAREYRRWILDFCSDTLGLINKTVPHVLFKKFAQSCWSELCEIYGIPPRYVKTNTQDPRMLEQAETMLREMGAAAAFVIDTSEEFQFAQGVSTNGDVYANLIRMCNQEISLLVSGAVMGQDTANGNYSKEEAAIQVLDRLIDADKRLAETYMNASVVPALAAIGWMPETRCRFRFAATEDTDRLWQITKELLPYKEVDNKWIEEKFGVPVGDKDTAGGVGLSHRGSRRRDATDASTDFRFFD